MSCGDDDLGALVAEAFGLGPATGTLLPLRHVSQETWRLDTGSGSYLVKRFWRGPVVPWQSALADAMELERRALEAGIDSPSPVPPVSPQFGAAAHLRGHGVFRAYPYLPHRPLDPADDVAAWAGATLARIHQLDAPLDHTPEPTYWYNRFPEVPPERWREWLARATAERRPWAPLLRERLPLVLVLSERVVEAFGTHPPYVRSHRDVEPWNVLMVPSGPDERPVLIDWDVAGPESAPLEAAHVAIGFARHHGSGPDAAAVRRFCSAYAAAGGEPPRPGPSLLSRALGTRLARLAARTDAALAEETPTWGPDQGLDRSARDAAVADRLASLPALVDELAEWGAALFRAR